MNGFAAAVERVWPGREARVEVLGGGITNHNLKVEVDGEQLRSPRRREGHRPARASIVTSSSRRPKAAAAVGIGPEVVAFVEPEGWLVTRFVDGEIPPLERMREPEMLARVAAALRAFHDGPRDTGSFRLVSRRRGLPRRRRSTGEEAFRTHYEWAHAIATRIEARRSTDAPVPCHNDLLNANFLDDGERLCIVDWEYAGMGDRFFDLANFSINHELDADASAVSARGVLRRGARGGMRRRSS